MSFEPSTNLDYSIDQNGNDDKRFLPQAPPPAAPPPSLPASCESSRASSPQANADGYHTFGSPTIVNYYETSPASRQGKRVLPVNNLSETTPTIQLFSTRGDANIRPNIGESNAAIGQDSLRESLWKGRIVNLVAAVLALLFEIPNFLGHVFLLHPARAVLGIYLTMFALLLLCFEAGLGRDFIRQQFGLLHHPIGRAFILLQMGGLAMGQGGILDVLLGSVFLMSSIYTMVTYCWYPEYRRRTAEEGEERDSLLGQARSHIWANPAEAASLLQKAMETDVGIPHQ